MRGTAHNYDISSFYCAFRIYFDQLRAGNRAHLVGSRFNILMRASILLRQDVCLRWCMPANLESISLVAFLFAAFTRRCYGVVLFSSRTSPGCLLRRMLSPYQFPTRMLLGLFMVYHHSVIAATIFNARHKSDLDTLEVSDCYQFMRSKA